MKGEAMNNKNPIIAMLVGLGIAYAMTAIIFILYAILITYTSISEKNLEIVVMITVVLSVLIAGFDSARAATSRGWLWGMGAGALYAIIMLCIGLCISPEIQLGAKTIMTIVLSLAGGGIGGILGINIKK